MSYLEIVPASSIPAVSVVDRHSAVVIDYSAVQDVVRDARDARTVSDDAAVRLLSVAVDRLAGTITEIVRAIDHGKVAVLNYPGPGGHVDE